MNLRSLVGVLCALGVPLVAPAQSLTDQYRETASRIIGAALVDEDGWRKLAYLCDRIGNRLSGSAQFDAAVRWSVDTMKKDGLMNVRTLPVKVPHWVRGDESVSIVAPIRRPLAMLGLGGSVATPAGGIEAEVVAVSSFDELERLGREKVAGRIVLFDVPFEGYRKTVVYRSIGASRAAGLGAVAVLLRSVGPVSLQTPHTGSLDYQEGMPRIPAAAITIEGATLIRRLINSGETVRARLRMEARMLPDAEGANVIGEIPGREKPEEVVVLGGHLDSWDVGEGAQDDGVGCVAALQAVELLNQLALKPRRTVRLVFWANEENGVRGGQAYREWAGGAARLHTAAIEMDSGSEQPIGFGLGLPPLPAAVAERAFRRAEEILALLDGIGASHLARTGGDTDIGPLMSAGVPGFGLETVMEHYFEWHHTNADTLDKVDKQCFRKNMAALAVLAYVLADMPDRLTD